MATAAVGRTMGADTQQQQQQAPAMGVTGNEHQQFTDSKRMFREYLSWAGVPGSTAAPANQFKDLMANRRARFYIDLGEMDVFRPGVAQQIVQKPANFLPGFDESLIEAIINEDSHYFTANTNHVNNNQADSHNTKSNEFPRVGISGVVGANYVTPRGLHSPLVGQMVCVEGIVARTSTTKPRARMSVYYCPATNDTKIRDHRDPCSLVTDLHNAGGAPKQDEQGNRFVQEYGFSLYKDYQKFSLQEMPEVTPTGQLPRGVEILASADLVNKVKPGDRVQISGVYRALPSANNGLTSGVFKFVVVACSVKPLTLGTGSSSTVMTAKDIKNIKQISSRDDTFELLSRSFAPSISGRDFEKKGLLLQAFGGAEKTLPNGTHLRGDVNILLIGDPSCGKSQLLRFVMNIAPLSISTTGRGSSGVGLTAAVTMDKESGDRVLEAGAMVLADRGIVCIDEFDKMSTADRVAIHEVMEQQTVTIAKAGIHTSLNARCSVLAAANPIYGNFDASLDLHKNVHLPDSLLSRFDLVFVVRDLMSEEEDRRISSQVLRQVRHRPPQSSMRTASAGDQDAAAAASIFIEPGTNISSRQAGVASGDTGAALAISSEVFEKTYSAINTTSTSNKKKNHEILTVEFLKKYIAYCKQRPAPVLTEQAIDSIAEIYAGLREQSSRQSLAVTTRTLESLIRLSTAHAKLKLKVEVEESDVTAARELMFASRGDYTAPQDESASEAEEEEDQENTENAEKIGKKRRNASDKPASGSAASGASSRQQPTQSQQPLRPINTPQVVAAPSYSLEEDLVEPPSRKARRQSIPQVASETFAGQLSDEKISALKDHVVESFSTRRANFLDVQTLREDVEKRSAASGAVMSEQEIMAGLEVLQGEGKIYIAADTVYLVM